MENPGEEIPVIIIDDDANKNSASDEDMEVHNPNMIIPTLVIGSPVTLDDDSTYSTGGDYMSTNTDTFAKRGILSDVDSSVLVLQYNGQPMELLDHGSDFKGFNYFNYDFRSIADEVSVTLTKPCNDVDVIVAQSCITNNLDMTLSCLLAAGVITEEDSNNILDFDELPDFAGNVCNVPLVEDGGNQDYTNIDAALDDMANCDSTEDITLVVSGMLHGDMAPVVADFMSFGYNDDGVQGSERVANQIIRIEAEETDDNTGVFEGALEYIMVNQLNVLDINTYDSVDPITDAPIFIVFEDLTDEDAPKVTYLDLGADGVATQVSDREEAPSHYTVWCHLTQIITRLPIPSLSL